MTEKDLNDFLINLDDQWKEFPNESYAVYCVRKVDHFLLFCTGPMLNVANFHDGIKIGIVIQDQAYVSPTGSFSKICNSLGIPFIPDHLKISL